jgi:16S rRNA (cytosine1402-N4)-methyltransferase
LSDIIRVHGEEPGARRLARAIVRARPIETTTQLAGIVAAAIGRPRGKTHQATRVFQALRIAVNQELDRLRAGLNEALDVLAPGGRLAVVSYHSLEDRVVKEFMRRESASCVCPPDAPECVCGHTPTLVPVTRRVERPSPAETRANPRSRSARLRVAERI